MNFLREQTDDTMSETGDIAWDQASNIRASTIGGSFKGSF